MLTDDVRYGTTTLQSFNSRVDTLLERKLRSNTLQIFCTNSCVLIGQVQLIALRFAGQCIGHYIEWAFPVNDSYGQLIHPLKPARLTST